MLKPEILKVFGIVTAAIIGATIAAAALAYFATGTTIGQPKFLAELPADSVYFVTNTSNSTALPFTLTGSLANDWQHIPSDAEYVFAIQSNPNPVLGYFASADTVVPTNWSSIELGSKRVVSKQPVPMLQPEASKQTVADVLGNATNGKWTLMSAQLREDTEFATEFNVVSKFLLIKNTTITALNTGEDALVNAVDFPVLDGATRISMSQNAFKYVSEANRTLLIARLEYLWTKASGITELPLDWWLQQGASTALQVEVQANGFVTIVGHTTTPESLQTNLEILRSAPKQNTIEWEEVYRELDSFTHSTIQLKEQTIPTATGSTHKIRDWNIELIDGTLIAHNGEFWLVSNAPLDVITPALQNSTPRLLDDTVATGVINANSTGLLPLEFMPTGFTGKWKLEKLESDLRLQYFK